MNLINLLFKADFLVKITISILILLSITLYMITIKRCFILVSASRNAQAFKKKFWSNVELSHLYQEILTRRSTISGIEKIFYVGFKEFVRLYCANNCVSEAGVKSASRIMHSFMKYESETLKMCIPLLNTIGVISPYIGLFGTICSVMHTFIILSAVGLVTLKLIALKIVEALLSTAIGLFTAVSAIIAFNYLNMQVNKLIQKYNSFTEEFITVLYRQTLVKIDDNKSVVKQ